MRAPKALFILLLVGLLAGVTPVTTLFGDSLRATLEERYRIGEAPSAGARQVRSAGAR